ncbi:MULTISPECIES: glycosyltransferase [unclassified Halomonas]|uniref:glycosyltransferase n=1 Tax=unclassified Halomonas TaxID=2609666 RepID=UPI0028863E87|nr:MULTISPECIES: glycosyltransferase [unclassified Halomonas]MDT0499404.1 glycosyltransferase [Halomonas sp. PAR7]MDT0510779.1 glycosyltransferase [Halomonas sp. LES1]MDT0591692.1 glycosyltransferase [Halomonas sp. PAR8]
MKSSLKGLGMKPMVSEEEIMATWPMATSEGSPLVTIFCATYNHEQYIASALDGMLAQKTSFPFEVVVNDDASDDGTADIIRGYLNGYPNLIQANLHLENQLRQGISPEEHTFPMCRGRYIAFCEGDDAWKSPDKLQRQIEMLEANPECDMAFHPAEKHYFGLGRQSITGYYGNSPRVVSAEEIIEKRYGSIPTQSVIVRSRVAFELLRFMKEQEDKMVADVYRNMLASQRGGACYLPEVMSLYRFRVPGSWSSNVNDINKKLVHYRRRIISNRRMDAWLKYRFTRSFDIANWHMILKILKSPEISDKERRDFYFSYGDKLGFPDRLLARLLLAWPESIDHYRGVREWIRRKTSPMGQAET